MPRKQSKPPVYCLHKASGQAVVRIHGRDRYLGQHGSTESYERYERALAEWRAGQLPPATPRDVSAEADTITINQLLLRYLAHAETYYVDRHGRPTKELQEMKYALRPVRRLYGRMPVTEFGPRALKAVRQHMIDVEGLSRKVINHRVNRIRRFFKWAVSEELAPAALLEGLRSVDGLQYGRTAARETTPVKPVPQEHVDIVLDLLSPQVRTMVQLQRLTAMRPQDVVTMRACDIDRSRDIWIYSPSQHKNSWREQERHVFIGPIGQALLRPYLDRSLEAYLFSPKEAETWRSQQRRAQRRTPITPSHARRTRKRNPQRAKRDRYDIDSYRRAISYAIQRINRQRRRAGLAEIPHWYPLQLRHSRATEIRRVYGLEGSQIWLGHKHAAVTELYAERNFEAGLRIAREVG